jgi:hypothetical protein
LAHIVSALKATRKAWKTKHSTKARLTLRHGLSKDKNQEVAFQPTKTAHMLGEWIWDIRFIAAKSFAWLSLC